MSLPTSKEAEKLNALFQDIDITHIDAIEFTPKNLPSFTLNTDNIKKITLYITQKLHKNTFSPRELQNAFDYLSKNIVSVMRKEEYDIVIGEIMSFIEFGWSVKIIEKNISKKHENTFNPIYYFFGTVLKVIAALIIIFIGAWITCGGNLILWQMLDGPGEDFYPLLYVLWAIELILILYFTNRYIFGSQKEKK